MTIGPKASFAHTSRSCAGFSITVASRHCPFTLPPQRIVVELDFTGRGAQRLWLVLEPHETSVCLKPPGFDPHLIVKADLAYFQRVWAGQIDYDAAVRSGHLVIEGAPALVRAFPRWLLWSPMARFVHAERERRSHAAAAV